MIRTITSLFLLCAIMVTLQAQDIHYAQSTNTPLNISPALTGMFRGDYRFAGSYRQQWQSVPVNYLQFTGAFDFHLTKKEAIYNPWSIGLLFNYDRAGDSRLSLTALQANASYTRQINANNFITAGAQVGVMQNAFEQDNLYFDDQYNGDTNDKPTQEVFDRNSIIVPDFSAGLNWQFRLPNKRTALHFGAAVFHLNRPSKSFFDGSTVTYDAKPVIYNMSTIQLSNKFDLLINAMAQWQGPHQEKLFGLGGRFHVNQIKTKEMAMNLNLSYRPGDAIVPQVGVYYKGWQVDMSYDINTSKFQKTTSMRGGPELSVIYIITKVPPLEYCPLCPTYL